MRAIAGADQLARLPSVHDVARRAGVSASTVSAVLTGRVPVRAATRAAVLAAARDLGYRPHAAARALRVGRATTVAFAVSEITSVTNAVVLRGAVAAAQQRDYDVSLFDLAGQSDHEDRFVDRLLRAPPQGAIIYTLGGALEAYQRAARRGVALTFIDRRPALEHVDYVSTDGGFGVARVVRHLVSLGRRRIAIIVGPQAQTVSRHRLDGYRDAYEAYGLEYAQNWSASAYRHPKRAHGV